MRADQDGGPSDPGPWGPEAVAAVAQVDPDRPAVVVGDDVLTFGALDERAGGLSVALRRRGEPGDRVLLRFDGLPALAVATLAVTEAAMVSVLVDPNDPVERVAALAAAVAPVGILSDLEPLDGLDLPAIEPADGPTPTREQRWAERPGPDALGSIAFTSGSTGEPKGIMLPVEERRGVERILGLLGITTGAGRRLGLPFTGSTTGADGPLHTCFRLGATIHGFDVRRQGLHEIEDWLLATQVDVFSAVPTAYRFLLSLVAPDRVFPHLELLVSFGEPLDGQLIDDLRRHLPATAQIMNVFGLTEARTLAALLVGPQDVVAPGPVAAGRVLDGIEVRIVDPEGRPVGAGEPGEIVVVSRTCGLGYWGRPELTAAVFGEEPDGRRRVLTGDAGRLRADGQLEHLGRLDHVVKVAGNRVDLVEVEAVVRSLPQVAQGAVVAVADRHGELRLRAAVVPAPGAAPDPAELRRALQGRLSRWLVPDQVQLRTELPTLATGKIDRRALTEALAAEPPAEPSADLLGPIAVGSTAPDLQDALLALWRTELEHPALGLDDDFFDAGGDSLRGARLFVAIEEELGLDRPLSLLVQHPTVRSLAEVLPIEREVWDVLVPVRTTGDGTPLVVVHGGHGEVLFARDLAALLPSDIPVYGLRAEALDGHPPRAADLEEVAAGYVDHVRRVRPHGPYALYGHSLGGVIALEMALRLQAEGEQVELLALGDSRAPGVSPHTATRGERLGRHLDAVRRDGTAPAVALLRRQVAGLRRRWDADGRRREAEVRRQRWEELTSGYPVQPERRGDHVLLHYGTMAGAYRPARRYPGRVLLLRAELSIAHRGWDRWLEDELEVVGVVGRHGHMARQPGLGQVAAALLAARRSPGAPSQR